jgi:hypothetical protein
LNMSSFVGSNVAPNARRKPDVTAVRALVVDDEPALTYAEVFYESTRGLAG